MSGKGRDGPEAETREARLRAALKANMARRKSQARGRAVAVDGAGRDDAINTTPDTGATEAGDS